MRSVLWLLGALLVVAVAGCGSDSSSSTTPTSAADKAITTGTFQTTVPPLTASAKPDVISCGDVDLQEGRTADHVTASGGADCATAEALAKNETVLELGTQFEAAGYRCVSDDSSDNPSRTFNCSDGPKHIQFGAHAFKDSQ